jgi:hypothetical protein
LKQHMFDLTSHHPLVIQHSHGNSPF